MEHYAGIDVSLELSSVCVVDKSLGGFEIELSSVPAPVGSLRVMALGRRTRRLQSRWAR
jgi:hypothetical protein